MNKTLRIFLLLTLGVFSTRLLAYEPCQRRLPIALSGPQIQGPQAKAEPAQMPCEKKSVRAWRVVFSEGTGTPSPVMWTPLETKGWKEEEGLIFLIRSDGSNRYVDLVLTDPATKEIFRYAITMRDPACRELFIPFKLLTLGGKPFKPQEHARVSLGWGLSCAPKSDCVFTAGDFFVGQLNPGEMAWPASTPPFVGTALYLETFEGAPQYKETNSAKAGRADGAPGIGLANSIAISLPSSQSEVRWNFDDVSRWQYFDGMTLWFKGDAAGSRFVIDLLATRLNGQGTVLYRHDFLMSGKGWDVEHIEWDDFLDDKGHNIEPDEFRRVVFSVRPASAQKFPLHIWIGPFRVDDE